MRFGGVAGAAYAAAQAGGGAFHPSDLYAGATIPGCCIDFTDTSTIFEDAGTDAAEVDDPIWQANDISGNGLHLIQASATVQPLRKTSGVDYALFDGTNDVMRTAATQTVEVGMTLFAAIRPLSASGTGKGIMTLGQSSTNYFAANRRNDVARSSLAIQFNALSVSLAFIDGSSTNDIPINTNCYVLVEFDDGEARFYRNGSLLCTLTHTFDGADSIGSCRFGVGSSETGSTFINAGFFSAGYVKKLLDSTEKTNLGTWLAGRYAGWT